MLQSVKILLVEDQPVIAMDVEAMLLDNGAGRVTTAATVAEALACLLEHAPDVAVLDVNLGTTTSVPIAEELLRRNIPFVFATGYGDVSMLPKNMTSAPVVQKPYEGAALNEAIAAAVAGRQNGAA